MTSSPPMPHAGHDVHRSTVEALAQSVTDGTFAVGSVLQLPRMAAKLEISRQVIGEALRVLVAKGVVDTGGRVRPQSEWNTLDTDVLRWMLGTPATSDGFFADLHELRRAVEPAAAALAAQHRTEAHLVALDGALADMAAAERSAQGDPALAARADATFHAALLTASGNRFFAQLPRVIEPALTARTRAVHAGPHRHPVPSHTEVAARVRAMDADGAYTAMLELLDVSLRDDP